MGCVSTVVRSTAGWINKSEEEMSALNRSIRAIRYGQRIILASDSSKPQVGNDTSKLPAKTCPRGVATSYEQTKGKTFFAPKKTMSDEQNVMLLTMKIEYMDSTTMSLPWFPG
jgi:hypothetical protein